MSAEVVRRQSRGRTITVWVLIAIASLVAVLSSTTTWLKRQALDTDSWVSASDEVLAKPAVQQALSVFIVDQLYQSVDITSELAQRLPDDFKQVAGPLSAALRAPAQQAVERLLQTPQFQQLWSQINRRAHAALVRVLENKTRVGSTEGGTVSLDLGQLVQQLGAQLGISQSTLAKIPASAGHIELIRSDQLKTAQKGVRAIKVLSVLLLLVVLVLYALAAYLSFDRRRTIRNIGWAVVLSAFILLTVRRGVDNYVVNLVKTDQFRGAADAVVPIWTSLLAQLGRAGVLYGITIVGWAFVAGPTRAGTAIRRFVAPALNLSVGLVACGAGALFLLLMIWSPTPAFDFGFRLLVLFVLYVAGIATMRVRTMAEFPDASFADVGGRMTAWFRRITHRGEKAAAAGAGVPAEASIDLAAIERLHQLHRDGALSDSEYESAKHALLAQPVGA